MYIARPRTAVAMSAKRVLVAVPDGLVEIETATAVDVLQRAGAEFIVASADRDMTCRLSRGMVFKADGFMIDAVNAPGDAGPVDAVWCETLLREPGAQGHPREECGGRRTGGRHLRSDRRRAGRPWDA